MAFGNCLFTAAANAPAIGPVIMKPPSPLNVFADDESLADIERRCRCTACGWRRADLRPDYSVQQTQRQSVGWMMPSGWSNSCRRTISSLLLLLAGLPMRNCFCARTRITSRLLRFVCVFRFSVIEVVAFLRSATSGILADALASKRRARDC